LNIFSKIHFNIRRKNLCFLIFSYIFFIYFSLPFSRNILMKLYSLIGPSGLNFIVLMFFVFIVIFVYFLSAHLSSKLCFLVVILTFLLFIGSFLFLQRPEERIHLIEYGFLGFLLFRLFDSSFRFSFFIALFLVLLFGILDEIIQFFLPNRVGDLKDVIVNFLGGLWGILLSNLCKS